MLAANIKLEQTTKLTMTQQLTQAIKLLQYSSHELTEFLESKAMENPLIEVDPHTTDLHYDHAKKGTPSSKTDKQTWLEQLAKEEASLTDYLCSQIDFRLYDNRTQKLLDFLINNIDDNGYIYLNTNEAAQLLQVSEEEIETGFHLIQALEPAGIGARNLQECLLLQIKRQDKKDPLAEIILSDFFLLFAERKWHAIAKQLGICLKDIQAVFDRIQSLNPRPGSSFCSSPSAYITPDIMVTWNGASLTVTINDEILPSIHYNINYYRKFNSLGDKQVKQFLSEKKCEYQWIMKSIEQRKDTIKRVAFKIVEKQPDFFIYGPDYLLPMTMREIAEELDIHESTVSRAVREKHIQTPFGTFKLSSFFSNSILTTANEDMSSHKVRKAITVLISTEDKLNPLSDQELVTLLAKNPGIKISRRTIAKYRDQLGIPSSSKRKRFA